VTPLMKVLGYQRTLQASDLWKMDETMAAAHLSEELDKAWACRVEEANDWNTRLELDSLEKKWRKVDGRREASLAWSLNVFGDTCQMMGPLVVRAIINFAKARSALIRN
ncbi:hypothetical protein C8R42DRAFT_679910, partial [Lentinula raphanica]